MRRHRRFVIRAAAALLGLASVVAAPQARAELVDPWLSSLPRLLCAADAVVQARLAPPPGLAAEVELQVERVLWVRPDLGEPVPARAWAPRCILHAGEPQPARALAFLAYDERGGFRLLGSQRGWIAGDVDAEAFVRKALELLARAAPRAEAAAPAGPAPPDSEREPPLVTAAAGVAAWAAGRALPTAREWSALLLAALDSPSARVREDALRGLAEVVPALPGALDPAQAERIAMAARAALRAPDPEPAVAVLAVLPGEAAEAGLLEAARAGLLPELVGPALAARPAAVAALIEQLRAMPGLAPAERRAVLRALGHSADRGVLGVLLEHLERAETRGAALQALAALGAPEAVPRLKRCLLGAERHGAEPAWAAVALAYTGGDEALGALEYARYNHPDPALRRFVAELLADPAAARAALRRAGNE
ncbi:MAG: hypothetical protein KatS3mg102_1402 [Planctomycetota bacterium]|nr:MAG: hypothetical protein KatS3mg102_1402 [Planctomycetota bacterium]